MNLMLANVTIDGEGSDRDQEISKSPHLFFRRLAYIAAFSTACILIFTGFSLRAIVSHYVIQLAERNSANISQVLSSGDQENFFTTRTVGGRKRICEIPYDRLETVDSRIRQFLRPFEIVKIKVYTDDTCIVYSTDRTIVGQRDSDNARLQNALRGNIDSELVRKNRSKDLPGESNLETDVVETYVPIYDDGEIIGCFELYMDVSRYSGEIQRIVTVGIIVIALIILLVYGMAFKFVQNSTRELKKAQDMLEIYAMTDPLTGLYNRRHILARAGQELARLQRKTSKNGSHPGIFVTLFDLDYFKEINDTYGHLVGDKVLVETARRILAASRPYDLVGRLGGDEFITVHPDADNLQSMGIANRIQGRIGTEPYLIEGKKIRVTASFGVAEIDLRREKDLTAALERADRALYKAKNSGRDRVI